MIGGLLIGIVLRLNGVRELVELVQHTLEAGQDILSATLHLQRKSIRSKLKNITKEIRGSISKSISKNTVPSPLGYVQPHESTPA